ncbi:MAG: deoxyguanosinetriphosphate triphosphohydrolase [Thiotrichales bacterium]|nr:deoxyguanosinetriphosphate triphosphohydrolase [Thiotrichales bacterium]
MRPLADYAASPETSRGRRYQEDKPVHRDEYQRDRDRIIHSAAFRRLEYKTQVFVNHEGDMFRTRLTHSIEVAQIGRSIARALDVNEDLTEAICLAHDLGHTPFGHAGQDELNLCMNEYGGFEHNLQSLRVVDVLEERYAEFPGLNLTFESREGILKHCSRKNAELLGDVGERFLKKQQPSLEAQISNIADEIAYNNHDVDDGVRAALLTPDQLLECELFRNAHREVTELFPALHDRKITLEVVRRMINTLVCDLIDNSTDNIHALSPQSIDDIRNAGKPLISLSEAMLEKNLELKRFLRKNLYQHHHVHRMTERARSIIRSLFDAYTGDISLLPGDVQSTYAGIGENTGKYRVISDYIAGMTDRFAISEYERLSGESAAEITSYGK